MFITESAKSEQNIFSPIKESVTFIIFIANLESISTMPHELQQWEGWELGNTKDTALFRSVGLVRNHRLESDRYIPQRWISASMWTMRVCTLSLWLQWGNTHGFVELTTILLCRRTNEITHEDYKGHSEVHAKNKINMCIMTSSSCWLYSSKRQFWILQKKPK